VNARMATAELLRLRKNRALFAWMVLMTTGAVAALYLIGQAFHWNDPAHNGPAGGAENLRHGLLVISFVGSVAASILGSTVGTSDLSSGVLRDLIVTGKSRVSLFAARVPGVLLFWVPLVLVAYVVAVAFDFAFAGNLATPGATVLVKDGLWVLMVTCIAVIASMGIASLIGSRGISIGVLLGWQLAVTPLVLNISALGVTRELLLSAATTRVQPFSGDGGGGGGGAASALHVSLAAAILVLVAWVVVPLIVGGWRTATRDA
jgi:ABC-type transport system involved in multi-copper enzyme maturation permease subunit